VVLQGLHDVHQLRVGRGVDLLQVLQWDGVADAGDHVLALRVLQVVAVDALLPGAGVAGERDAGAGVHAQVAEDHRHDVHRGAEVGRDPFLAPVQDRPVGVPRAEHGQHGEVHLLPRVLRELTARVHLHEFLESLHDPVQVARVEVEIVLRALGPLRLLDRVLEGLTIDAEHGLAEHLDQAAVGVPGEPLAARLLGQATHRLIGQADVQHRLHHAGHGELGPRPDADQQRVGRVAELPAHLLFQLPQVLADLAGEPVRDGALTQVLAAGLGGDDEPRRHRQAQVGHLRQIRALAAEQVLQVLISLSEVVDELRHCTLSLCLPRPRASAEERAVCR
jgi:hypothetical protein